ncbi:hypothetical protein TcasGA2_TC010991 [Tribolium castaneum]|uniref:Uncharacterized protein n=1 Tax=Tribolium castaneum TaxID=7070 RepID=D6X1H6_TRICA|nr:hypothetical protein TcasGA2_TC010991 [Tribolium castaneum]
MELYLIVYYACFQDSTWCLLVATSKGASLSANSRHYLIIRDRENPEAAQDWKKYNGS